MKRFFCNLRLLRRKNVPCKCSSNLCSIQVNDGRNTGLLWAGDLPIDCGCRTLFRKGLFRPRHIHRSIIMADNKYGPQTLALHAGHIPDSDTGSRAVPIYQTTAYMFRDTSHAADLFALKDSGYIYSRLNNPTTDVLEKRLAALHGGVGALAVSSGMAAIFYAVTALVSTGQNIVSGSNLYGGTQTLFGHTLKRFGIEARFVDSSDPANFEAAIDENTRLVYSESIGNPRCNVDDLLGIAKVAHAHGLPFILDSTVAPPPIFNPFDFGCDIAVPCTLR
eukprot:TRINITY_DN9155_c0_g1_i2.p1 TRINITY_DN9155_c0_g1~~TRINITY_DN9155_c0_g1_i2.p1  ORF type:complete len:278 (+),score=40.78 TRINITY_DN9155_c0_g1_i2:142-975(+)